MRIPSISAENPPSTLWSGAACLVSTPRSIGRGGCRLALSGLACRHVAEYADIGFPRFTGADISGGQGAIPTRRDRLPVIGGSAVTNWLVDPFGKLGRNEIGIYSSSERDAKPQMIHVYPHGGIVVGSSRVTYIDPSSIDRNRLFNAGFSEAMPLEFLKLFAVKQRLVVVALDFTMFNERNYPVRKDAFAGIAPITPPDDTARSLPTYKEIRSLREYLISRDVLVSTIKTLVAGVWIGRKTPFLGPAGNRNAREAAAKNARMRELDYGATLEHWRARPLRLSVLRGAPGGFDSNPAVARR